MVCERRVGPGQLGGPGREAQVDLSEAGLGPRRTREGPLLEGAEAGQGVLR